jgi:hypothetical protein
MLARNLGPDLDNAGTFGLRIFGQSGEPREMPVVDDPGEVSVLSVGRLE